jgi:hypothetical protein
LRLNLASEQISSYKLILSPNYLLGADFLQRPAFHSNGQAMTLNKLNENNQEPWLNSAS